MLKSSNFPKPNKSMVAIGSPPSSPQMETFLPAFSADFIMFFSPDGNHLPEDIPKLIQKTKEGHNAVHISRFGKNSVSDDANWLDRFGNYMFTFLVNSFFGGKYTDALNGFRIIKRSIWDKLKTDAQYLNIEQQTCIRLAKLKIPIYEIEGNEPARIGGERKMRPLTTGAQLSYQILKLIPYYQKKLYFVFQNYLRFSKAYELSFSSLSD